MEYNANSVQQLTFREGVRERIGIYLGSADHTGVLAGLLELVNNATDEALVCDTANKIGTYTVAIAAKYHNIPFYIAAPLSTIDASIKTGAEIPIEERNREEVTHINGKLICAEKGVNIINPGFDVTPNELITGIITEKGILRPDYNQSIAEVFKNH